MSNERKSLYLITAATDKEKTRGLAELTDDEFKLLRGIFDDLNENCVYNAMPEVNIKWIGYDGVKPLPEDCELNWAETPVLDGERYVLL